MKKATKHVSGERLVDYFDGLLSLREKKRIEEHLADCDPCAELAGSVRKLQFVFGLWTAARHAAALKRKERGG